MESPKLNGIFLKHFVTCGGKRFNDVEPTNKIVSSNVDRLAGTLLSFRVFFSTLTCFGFCYF